MSRSIFITAALVVLVGVFIFAIYAVLFDGALFRKLGEPAKTVDQAQENIFYNAPLKTPDGSVPVADPTNTQEYKLARTDNYEIVYQKKYDLYIIAILKRPVEEARKEAEQEFLRLINADLAVACRLQVTITVPAYVDPLYAGEEFSLNGC